MAVVCYYVFLPMIGFLSYNYCPVGGYDFLKKMSLHKNIHIYLLALLP